MTSFHDGYFGACRSAFSWPELRIKLLSLTCIQFLLLLSFIFNGNLVYLKSVFAKEMMTWYYYKLGRGRWDLASCQVLLNSVGRFQRRSRKCLSQSEAMAAILFFRTARKNTNLVEDVEILLPVKFHWIPFSGFRREVENVSANQRQGLPFCFSDRPEKHKLGRGRWDLAFFKFR